MLDRCSFFTCVFVYFFSRFSLFFVFLFSFFFSFLAFLVFIVKKKKVEIRLCPPVSEKKVLKPWSCSAA